jgi:hypothetical protein
MANTLLKTISDSLNSHSIFEEYTEDDNNLIDNLVDHASFSSIVEKDARTDNRSSKMSDKDYNVFHSNRQILLSDPRLWKDELVRIKQNVEMTLTSLKEKMSRLRTIISDENAAYEKVLNAKKELSELRVKRVNTIRFMHAIETRLLEVNSVLRDD